MRQVQLLVDALFLSRIEINELDDAAVRWKNFVTVNTVKQIASVSLRGAIEEAITQLMPADIIGVITAALLGTSNVLHESASNMPQMMCDLDYDPRLRANRSVMAYLNHYVPTLFCMSSCQTVCHQK